MYELIIETYEMIDTIDPEAAQYNRDVFEDPEFYGISYSEYSLIKYYAEVDESDTLDLNEDGTINTEATMKEMMSCFLVNTSPSSQTYQQERK